VKGNTVTAVEQAVCTGVHNLRALTRVSLRPIPQWATLQDCTAVEVKARRRRAGKRAMCACLWRADACAEVVTVARTAGARYVSSSGR